MDNHENQVVHPFTLILSIFRKDGHMLTWISWATVGR
jgi:hypothetical protein